ncbi:MAG: hypothetical protein COA42_21000 [Alteromonadaceae bacterium]|nr:MAG: hypothetical protein COA42_21000 [Alteromonadaceae bacterium]
MGKFANPRKDRFLKTRPRSSVETSDIAARCKFNLSFFDASQEAGQDFADWNNVEGLHSLATLMEKIKEYTKEPLSYWRNNRSGSGGLKILSYYDSFPKDSDFIHPAHVPHDAIWARFRLGNKVRLIGFVVPEVLVSEDAAKRKAEQIGLDANTFYVVFLDKDHRFYKSESR